jgi:twinkle protein
MSMSQVQGNKWPVVSVKDGAGSAARSIRENIEWISSFDEVVLMFDNDEPGRDAAQICAELLPPGKASIATLPLKDANEMLVARRGHELISAMWQAKPYRPDGIVEGTELWDRLQVADPVTEAEYPFFRLNANLRGLRRGELVTFCAGTGVGKSTVCRETAFSLIQSGEQVGYIALEESVKRTATALMSLHLNRPLHLDPMAPDDPEFKGAFEATVGSGRIAFYDHWGSVDSETLLSKIRFMAVGLGCRWVFLDHISIMVSGIDSNDSERILLDRAMTHLASLAREVNIGLIVVCHLSKSKEKGKSFEEGARPTLGDLRGTAGISQLSDSVVAFARDQQDPDDRVVQVFILKSRFTGFTGPSGELVWNGKTGRLQDEEGTRFTSDDDDGGGDENLGSEDGSEAGSEF